MGFELAVRLAKFAFEFSAEFPALVIKFGFGENFAAEVLDVSSRLVSAVRFAVARWCGTVGSNKAWAELSVPRGGCLQVSPSLAVASFQEMRAT